MPPPQKPASGQSLAAIRRRQKEEAEETIEQRHLQRVKLLNYTSEDSHITRTEKQLRTYYCEVCGTHSLVTDADLSSLPTRTSDGAAALEEAEYFVKRYMNEGDKVLIMRGTGVETQYRYVCKECGMVLAYRPAPEPDECKYSYFFPDALIEEQSRAKALEGTLVGPSMLMSDD